MVNIQTIFVHEKGTQSNTVGELENYFYFILIASPGLCLPPGSLPDESRGLRGS